jgi:hypothetical protein
MRGLESCTKVKVDRKDLGVHPLMWPYPGSSKSTRVVVNQGHEDEERWLQASDAKPQISKLADGKKRAYTSSDSYSARSLADRDRSTVG